MRTSRRNDMRKTKTRVYSAAMSRALRQVALVAAMICSSALTSACSSGGDESTERAESMMRDAFESADNESDDMAESMMRDLLESSVIDESRDLITDALARGESRSIMARKVDAARRQGAISESTACLQRGLVYGLSDDEIVKDCRSAYEDELSRSGVTP